MDLVHRMAEIFDEPLADATCIPIYFISQKAREEGSKVVLTGDGSDELFAGYRSYARYLRYYPWFHGWEKMPGILKNAVSSWVNSSGGHSPVGEMLHRAARNQEFFWGEAKSFKESVKEKFLSPEYKSRSAGWNSYEVIESYRNKFGKLSSGKSDLDWMCYLGFKMTDANRFLYRADRLGMAHSIELRAPFMDTDLVNFALSVPQSTK
jgi:asparagine synthase (glutamine-hydrolysing)